MKNFMREINEIKYTNIHAHICKLNSEVIKFPQHTVLLEKKREVTFKFYGLT